MRKLNLILALLIGLSTYAQPKRIQQYQPLADAFVCDNGDNRYTRALYGSHTDWRLETSDRPIFAIFKKGHHRNIRFVLETEGKMFPLEETTDCHTSYINGRRDYTLSHKDWPEGQIKISVMAMPDREAAIWRFSATRLQGQIKAIVCNIAQPKLQRNGDIGVDKPGCLEPSSDTLQTAEITLNAKPSYMEVDLNVMKPLDNQTGEQQYKQARINGIVLSEKIVFRTPDPYINTLGGALVLAADGDWDGQTWLHGCIGWRMPLAGWRAGYLGDVLGWNDRAVSHFDAYARSQVTKVKPTIPHPSQDAQMNLARAEKRWGTQMYSNGYICRNPERDDQMHHYDMNLNYIDELLWHFQYDADTTYMKKMWPVIKSHLAWEKRNFDPDDDHLYDAYCCIWASDALYYSGGAVTHSSAYNYRGNKLAARIAEIIGEDSKPYREEADAILKAMNERLWLPQKGVWAEYQDALGLQRKHDHPAVWSIYTPIDCGACTPEQAYQATRYIDDYIPHIDVEDTGYQTIATSDWLPYAWSINNVAAAEVMHTALAYFEAGRKEEGFRLMKANILDQMYYGASPGNFGQISYYDAARGECYRDFGDCIGISSRTLIQGLFGIIPQALEGQCIICPGFPNDWEKASIETPYLKYKFTREGNTDCYEITQNFRRPLRIVFRQYLSNGKYRDIEGTSEKQQIIKVSSVVSVDRKRTPEQLPTAYGLEEPDLNRNLVPQPIDCHFNANVSDIFKNRYLSPRPKTTTLQIPVQGIGEWCHPQQTAEINDAVFRSKIKDGIFTVAGVPFRTPAQGHNIIYTSLWDNYPDFITIPLNDRASAACLFMAGSTNHMQSRIDNGLVIATYADNTCDTLALRNPNNWCPIERDYYVDGKAFQTTSPRPYRICLGTGDVSRDLGQVLNIQGVYGREIPGGAAQMLRMCLNPKKQLKSLTVQTLSNDVVIGLMGITLEQ